LRGAALPVALAGTVPRALRIARDALFPISFWMNCIEPMMACRRFATNVWPQYMYENVMNRPNRRILLTKSTKIGIIFG
jgi:hypothetical protein